MFCPAHHILHATSRRHYWEGEGALSIKTFSNGRAYYSIGAGYHEVDESAYLILNEGQCYSVAIESDTPVESFCLFFQPGLMADVHRNNNHTPGRLLDNPIPPKAADLRFFERTYSHDTILSPALTRLKAHYLHHASDSGWLTEQMHDLAQRLLRVHHRIRQEVETMPAVRMATRDELYRRIYRARDYISACFEQPIMLHDIARTASLSPNHLLRVFRHTFDITPHQYLTQRRLEQARKWLRQSTRSVTDICFSIGFESLGSFSTLFRRHTGLSPRAYRLQKSDFQEEVA